MIWWWQCQGVLFLGLSLQEGVVIRARSPELQGQTSSSCPRLSVNVNSWASLSSAAGRLPASLGATLKCCSWGWTRTFGRFKHWNDYGSTLSLPFCTLDPFKMQTVLNYKTIARNSNNVIIFLMRNIWSILWNIKLLPLLLFFVVVICDLSLSWGPKHTLKLLNGYNRIELPSLPQRGLREAIPKPSKQSPKPRPVPLGDRRWWALKDWLIGTKMHTRFRKTPECKSSNSPWRTVVTTTGKLKVCVISTFSPCRKIQIQSDQVIIRRLLAQCGAQTGEADESDG